MSQAASYERQKAVFDSARFAERRTVDVIGTGGVGGFIAADLAAEGVPVRAFDPKSVSPHNPPNQVHSVRHIGLNKAVSVDYVARFFTGRGITAIPEAIGSDYAPGNVVFLCVDQMLTRREVLERIFALKKQPDLVIETRIDTNYVVVHTLIPSNKKHQNQYWRYWFPDQEAVNDGGCSDKRALRCAATLAACVAVSQLVQWFGNGKRNLNIAYDNQIRITMRPWSSEAHQW